MNYMHPISIAPMMARTDRHFRHLLRLITQHSLLYTEMIHTHAILHNPKKLNQEIKAGDNHLALQLGGASPIALAECAARACDLGFSEINLNAGCPSERVQSGRFGACLMKEGDRVAKCLTAMQKACNIPITLKTRIGVDEHDSYSFLSQFIHTIAQTDCKTIIIHARKAWLKGLSPKENRTIPPLRYETVYQLKKDFPQLTIIINGGIKDIESMDNHLQYVDGVMLGRIAYQAPLLLSHIDSHFYNEKKTPSSTETILSEYLPYVSQQQALGVPLNLLTQHLMGLFQGQAGAKQARRTLSIAGRTNNISLIKTLRSVVTHSL